MTRKVFRSRAALLQYEEAHARFRELTILLEARGRQREEERDRTRLRALELADVARAQALGVGLAAVATADESGALHPSFLDRYSAAWINIEVDEGQRQRQIHKQRDTRGKSTKLI